MSWNLLPTNFTDAVWTGLRRFAQIYNEDGSVSFQDVTIYSNRERSFFGALNANRMNEALNIIMSMVENGTNLYEAFQIYFAGQKTLFELTANSTQSDFEEYVAALKAEGDTIILTLKVDYRADMDLFQSQQQQIFDAWFQAMRDQLSQDAAGHLQNQTTELDQRLSLLEQMTLQNDFSAPLATDDANITLIVDDLDFALLADWKFKEV